MRPTMIFSRFLPYACLCTMAARAQSDSSSSSSSGSQLTLSGSSEASVPTGSYLSYSTTITIATSSPITTSAIVSTITSGSFTITTTLGSTTIFGLSTTTYVGNATANSTASSTSSSQLILHGSARSTAVNGTGNSTATATSSSTQPTNTTPCNNYPEFCSRKYGNITEVAAHNSPFIKSGNAAANQGLSVTTQLNDGIRLLQGQMHFVNSTPHFCHTSCDILDAGPITEYLTTVKDWISQHPYDVVTILLENGDYNPVEAYVPFLEQTGLIPYAYLPPKIPMNISDWPTLSSMILTGKRLVLFMDYNANQTSVPYVLDEFSQMWETPFDPTNRSFPCTVQRPPNLTPAETKSRLYTINHNLNYDISLVGVSLSVPNIPLLNVTNNITGFGSLGVNAEECESMWDYPPKFLNVDYYNVGNGSVFEVAAKWNNVTYSRPCCGLPVSGAARTREWVGRSAMFAAACVVLVNWLML